MAAATMASNASFMRRDSRPRSTPTKIDAAMSSVSVLKASNARRLARPVPPNAERARSTAGFMRSTYSRSTGRLKASCMILRWWRCSRPSRSSRPFGKIFPMICIHGFRALKI